MKNKGYIQRVSQCDGDKDGGEHDGLGSFEDVAAQDEMGLQGVYNVLVTRKEVNMMGLVVLRVWLVMLNRGYRYVVVILNTESGWEMVLQQDSGVVELDSRVQGCDARLRGRCHTAWVYFGMRGFVLECWDISALLCSG